MKILQRYIIAELAGPFVMGTLVLTFVLLTAQLFRLTDYLINRGVSLELFLRFLGALLPQIFTLTMPMGLLVAVLLAYGRLSADREIMAIRTSGVNVGQLYWPTLLAGLALTCSLYYFTNTVVPATRLGLTGLKGEVAYILQSAIEPNQWHSPDTAGDDRLSLNYMKRGADGRTLENVSMHMITSEGSQEGSNKEEVIITAREGNLTPLAGLDALTFELRKGALHLFNKLQPTNYTVIRFDRLERDIRLETDRVAARGIRSEEQVSPQLRQTLAHLEARPNQDRKAINIARTELRSRLSMPLAALVFVLVGMPLGVMGRTSGKAVGFAMAFGLIFFYYMMLRWGTSISLDGHALGAWAVFLPNIVMGVLGTLLIGRSIRA